MRREFEIEVEAPSGDVEQLKRLKRHGLKTRFTEDTRLVLTDSSSFAAAWLASDNVLRLGS